MVKPLPKCVWAVCVLYIFMFFHSPVSAAVFYNKLNGKKLSHSKALRNHNRLFDNVIAASGPLCSGSSITLSLSGSPAAGSVKWFKDNMEVIGESNATIIINSPGDYYATTGTGAGLETYSTLTITTIPKPLASFTFTGNNQCMGQLVTFTNHSSGTGLTYRWDFGDPNSGGSNTSTLQNPTHNFVGIFGGNNQQFTVKLTITNAGGCSDTFQSTVTAKQQSDTQLGGQSRVTYNNATFFTACGSGATQMTFVNQSTTNGSNASYHIDWGDGSTFDNSTFTSTTHNYTVGTWQLTYSITSTNGCVNTSTYYVFVGSTPSGTIDEPPNATFCTGGNLTFTISNTSGNTAGTTYQIIFSDGSATQNFTTATIPSSITHTFTTSSCGKTSGGYSNAFSATLIATNPCSSHTSLAAPVYVSQKPQAAFTMSKSTSCVGQTVNFTNNSLGNEVSQGTCNKAPIVWTISPSTGWTNAGNLGNDFGQSLSSLWSSASDNVDLTFNTPGTYTVSLKIGNSCSNDVITKKICVNATPTASFTVDHNSGCGPLVVNTNNTSPAPNCGTNTYQWSVSPSSGFTYTNATTSTFANPQYTFTNAGTYVISLVTTSPGSCSSTAATQTVTVNAKPSVTLNSNSTMCQGSTFTPTATVTSSSTPTYAWTFDGGTPSSSTSASPGPVQYTSTGTFTTTLVVTNDCGSTTKTSTVTVNATPVATVPTDQTFCSGSASGTLGFTSTVAGTTFNWTNSNTAIGLAASGSGNGISFNTANVTSAQVAMVTVTPSVGSCTGSPVSFKITVSPRPAVPTVAAGPVYCLGDAATPLNVTPAGGNTLKWYSDAALTHLIAGTPTPSTALAGTTTYYVTQTNGSCESSANSIQVIVNPGIVNNIIGSDQTICEGGTPQQLKPVQSVSGGSGAYTYQWEYSTDNGANWSGMANNGLAAFSPGALTVSTQYRRLIYSSACISTSNVVSITVQGTLSNYNITGDQTICSGLQPASIQGQSPVGGSGVYNYQWESSVNGVNWTPLASSNTTNYAPPVLTATTYYHRITTSGSCSGTSNAVKISVNPLPVVNAITSQTICNGSATSAITFGSSTGAGTVYNWTNDNAAIGLAASGAGNIASFTPTNTTHSPVTANISVTGTAATCTGLAANFSFTALPLVTIQPVNNMQVCPGTLIPALTPVNDADTFTGSSVTYTWTSSNPAVGLIGGSGIQVPSFTATNTGTTNLVSTITVTPVYHYNGRDCNGTPRTFTVTVQAGATIANAGSDVKLCNNSTYKLNGNVAVVGTGTWNQVAGPAMVFDNPHAPNAKVTGLTAGTHYKFTWTIDNAGCPSNSSSVNVDVMSDIFNSIKTLNAAICPGSNTTLQTDQLSGGNVPGTFNASYTYSWESSGNNSTWQTISGANGESYVASPATNTYYRRNVSSYGQCTVTSNVVLIKVNAVTTQATTGPDVELCNLPTIQLNGNSPAPGFTGTWSDLNPISALVFSDPHSPQAVVTGLQPGNTYMLKWTIAGVCGITSAILKISDYQPLTNTIPSGNITVCYGVPTQITAALPTGGSGIYQYTWQSSSNGGSTWNPVPGQNNKDFNYTLTQSSQLRRDVTSGTCESESNVVNVTVQPPITNNSISGLNEVCTGKSAGQLTGSNVTGGDGNYLYTWQSSLDNATWSNVGNQASFITPALTQSIYYRRIVSTALCTGAQQSVSNILFITVDPNARAEFSASSTTQCAPFDLRSVITVTPYSTQNASYEWFADGVSIGHSATFPAYTMTTANKQVLIKLVTTSSFGCDTSSHQIVFKTIPTVAPSFTKNTTSGCGPLTVHFTNTSQPLGAGTYLWDFGNGVTSTQAQPNDVVFPPHPLNRDTTYVITLKATTSCSVNIYKDSVHVRPAPKAIFTPDQTIGCSPFTINITNQSRGVPNTYTFYFGDGQKLVKSDNSPLQYTYTTLKTDTLTLKMVAENECGKDSASYRIVVFPNTVNANLVVNGDNKFGCAPMTVKFDNNSTGANSFNWTFGDGNTATTHVAPESMTHTFTTPGVYTVKLLASNGCSTASTTQTITVYPQPVALFSVAKLQYCVKDSVLFSNQSLRDSSAFKWDFGDGRSSNDVNPKHVFANPGKYTVLLTIIRSYANGSVCSSTISHEVDVIPLPTAAFTSNSAPLNCAPFTLSVNTTPANATSVEWNFGDPGSPDNRTIGYTARHTFLKAGVYKVKLIAYNANGCIDSTSQVVRLTETPVAAYVPSDTVLCGNSSTIHFTNQSSYRGSDLVTYKWIVNNALISTQHDLTYTFTPPSNAVYPYIFNLKLVASSTIGCSDTITHKIQFNGLPKAAFSLSVSSSCAPFKAVITNSSLYADLYKWYVDGALVSTDKMPNNIIFSQSSQTYRLKLVVNNLYGCRADSVEKVITTYPKPTAAFSLQDSVSCNGKLDIKVTNSSTGATTYNWNFGDGSAQSSAVQPSHLYGAPGVYPLRLIANNGYCTDTVIHNILIASPPKAAFTADNLKGCTLVTTTFQNASVNASSYVWDFGDGTYSTSKNPTHSFNYLKSPYNIKLIVFGDYGCSDTTILANYISVSTPPTADFTVLPDTVIKIPDYSFSFKNASSADAISYRWNFGDRQVSSDQNPSHAYADTGVYRVSLIVTNKDNCTDTLIRRVQVAGVPGYLYVPNAFEPGSGKLELKTFTVRASGLSQYSLKIFNKWGELIWQTDKLSMDGVPVEGWDGIMHGIPAPQGVYIWTISAKFINGTEWKGMKYPSGSATKTGTLNLMR